MSTKKTSNAEEEYIALEEAEKKKRLQEEFKTELIRRKRESTKDIWYMTCPKCGADIEEIAFRGFKVEKCSECRGIWLDNGELEKLAGPESHSIIAEILELFKPD